MGKEAVFSDIPLKINFYVCTKHNEAQNVPNLQITCLFFQHKVVHDMILISIVYDL